LVVVKALLSNRQPILAVIVFSCLAISLAFRNVESVSIASLVSLPDGATPYGIVYDASRKLVWTVGYGGTGTVPASCLYRIDPVGKTYTRYFPSGDTNELSQVNQEVGLRGITLDAVGRVWVCSDRGYSGPSDWDVHARIWRFNPATASFTSIRPNNWGKEDLAYDALRNKVYCITYEALLEIDSDSMAVVAYPVENGFGSVLRLDASGNIWFSRKDLGKLFKFNGTALTSYGGFRKPYGFAFASNGTTYVAEYNIQGDPNSPAIVRFDPSTQEKKRFLVTGSPYDVLAIGSTVWWSSSGEDSTRTKGTNVLLGPSYAFSSPCFRMASDGVNVWGGYFGSPHGVFEVTNAGTITVVFRTVLPVYVGTSLVGYYTLSTATEILGGVATTTTTTRTVTETKTVTVYTTSPTTTTTTTTSPTTTVTGTKIATRFAGVYKKQVTNALEIYGRLETVDGVGLPSGLTVIATWYYYYSGWSSKSVATSSGGYFSFVGDMALPSAASNIQLSFAETSLYLGCSTTVTPS